MGVVVVVNGVVHARRERATASVSVVDDHDIDDIDDDHEEGHLSVAFHDRTFTIGLS